MSATKVNSTTAIWSRAIQAERGDLSPEAAHSILGIRLSDDDRRRAEQLAVKATESALSPAEEDEIESYRSVGRLLELMKSKARQSLRGAGNLS